MSVFIIAEAGVNHNGSIDLAKKLIDVACEAGADAVKFQTFNAKNLVTKNLEKANYQKKLGKKSETQFNMLKKLELNQEIHIELINYCKLKKIIFLSSPFDLDSINLLNDLNLEIFKIPSGEITNLPYLRHIGKLNKKIILSTGMSNMNEVKNALDILIYSGTQKKNITVLHANTEYPTPIEDVNLNSMVSIGTELDINFGYSDHTQGIEVDIAAVAMGAKCIEKHFTLNSKMKGPDHKASVEPEELKSLVDAVRNINMALGDGRKRVTASELENIKVARKSLVAATSIEKGDRFSKENITVKRPGVGISPMRYDEIIGKLASRDFCKDDLIEI